MAIEDPAVASPVMENDGLDKTRLQRSIPLVSLLLVLVGMGLAAYGQYLLIPRDGFWPPPGWTAPPSVTGAVLMSVGGVLFFLALVVQRRTLEHVFRAEDAEDGGEPAGARAPDAGRPPAAVPFGARQAVGLAIGIAGGVGAFLMNDHNTFALEGVAAWLLGGFAIVWGFWRPSQRGPFKLRITKVRPSRLWAALALICIVSLAAFLRFYDLDDVPDQGGEHAIEVYDVKAIWDGDHPVYFTTNEGREPLALYLSAAIVPLFGFSFLTIKVITAAAGTLAVPAVYAFSRELFARKGIALLASVLLALSYWQIEASRLGWRPALVPLFATLTLLFMFRSLKYNRTNDFLLCGLFLGASLYTYTAIRILPLAVGLSLLVGFSARLLRPGRGAGVFLGNAAILVLASLVVFAPLGHLAMDEPELFWRRVEAVGTDGDATGTLETVANNFKGHLLMFNFAGDSGGRGFRNVWGSPHLDFLTGSFLLLGAAIFLLSWWSQRRSVHGYAFLVFLVLLAASFGSLQPVEPHSHRAIGVTPLVFAAAALPPYLVLNSLRHALGRKWVVVAVPVIGAGLGLIGYMNYQHYFRDYQSDVHQNWGVNREVTREIQQFTRSGGDLDNAYIKLSGEWVDGSVVAVQLGALDWHNFLFDIEEATAHVQTAESKLYIVHGQDVDSLRRLSQIYPQGTAEEIESSIRQDFDFVAFQVPARSGQSP